MMSCPSSRQVFHTFDKNKGGRTLAVEFRRLSLHVGAAFPCMLSLPFLACFRCLSLCAFAAFLCVSRCLSVCVFAAFPEPQTGAPLSTDDQLDFRELLTGCVFPLSVFFGGGWG